MIAFTLPYRRLLYSIVAVLITACSSKPAEVTEEPTAVKVEKTTSGPAAPAIATNGLVSNKEELRLSFKVTGVIERIAIEEGQKVKTGQRLAQIQLTEIDSEVEQARLLEDKARRNLARGEKLYTDRLISLEQLEDLRTQTDLALAQLRSAKFNRAHSTIVAPSDGVILRRLAEERELIPAGQQVLVMGTDAAGYIVRAALADRDVVQLKLGDPAQIRLDAYPQKVFAGAVSEIASAADEKTGMFPVEIRFDAPPQTLASGLVARLELHPGPARTQSRTYVPISAIIEGDGDIATVFVVDGGRAKQRRVRVAFFAADAVALEEGLQSGEPVVTEGALYLQDGEPITIVPAQE